MLALDPAVNIFLENLSRVLQYNSDLIADARDSILILQQELLTLRGLSREFAKYYNISEYPKEMMKQITEIIGEAEDAVDVYLLHVTEEKSRGFLFKAFHRTTDYPKVLRDVATKIAAVGYEVGKFIEQRVKNSYKIRRYETIADLSQAGNFYEEVGDVEEEHVIGRDDAVEEVKELLTRGSEHLEVISIVGMVGLGKTTLAKKVFKDPDVDYEFMIRAFVYVSRQYEIREVFLKILSCFSMITDEVMKMSEEQLTKYLHRLLEGKQYLVVLDDVWEKEDWDRLKVAFPKNNKRCRVLITTRNARVAWLANPEIDPYTLRFLSLEEARELLRWRVFRENSCPMELQEYEIAIAMKCDGLPLAIKVIAGIIVKHRDRAEFWKEVANNVKDYIARDATVTTDVIELMYKHLPNHMKPCFLYLGVFGENLEIPVWKLVRLWIAEGLIQQEGNFNLEDVAKQYLEELVHRNLAMVGRRRRNRGMKTIYMHSTLGEFCKKQAREENLFHEIQRNNLPFFLSGNPVLDQYRRLCVNNVNILDYISGEPSGKFVRSFLSFVREEMPVEPNLVSRILRTFNLLKVLEIQSLILTRFPFDLCKLALLNYIAISTHITILPSSLSSLFNLQTLIVNTTSRTLEIKADIWKMPQFRHLHTNASASLPSPCTESQKSKVGALVGKNVQTLSTISPESCQKEVFDRTPKLKKLGVIGTINTLFEGSCDESSLFGHFRRLESLENLKLLNDDVCSRLYRLPPENFFPKQLTMLTLLNTLLDWEEMTTLAKLEKLEVLKLKEYAFQGKLWVPEKGGFLRLTHLYIGRTDLVVWEASVDHFPQLKSLELNSCDMLQAVPSSMADIPSLELVVLFCTNTSVASSARRLQVLKLHQAKKGFELSVYPPEH